MTYLITYCHDTKSLQSKGLALVAAGKYKHLIGKTEEGRLNFRAFFCPVAYKDNKSIGYGSLSHAEIYGDDENGIPSFLDEMGFTLLNAGSNGIELYDGMSTENKALYESVKPPIKLVDSEGNETGEERFNYHVVIDGGY